MPSSDTNQTRKTLANATQKLVLTTGSTLQIEEYIALGDFLSAMKAIDRLNADHQLPLPVYTPDRNNCNNIQMTITAPSQKLIAFVNSECKSAKELQGLKG